MNLVSIFRQRVSRRRALVDRSTRHMRPRPATRHWSLTGAVVVLAMAGCESGRDVTTTPSPSSAVTSETGGPRVLARGEGLSIMGVSDRSPRTLSVEAVEQDGKVTGEFRMNNIAVALVCVGTRSSPVGRDLILAGRVTDAGDRRGFNPDVSGEGALEVGAFAALIIRRGGIGDPNGDSERVTFQAQGRTVDGESDLSACTRLVDSIPEALDGGFFEEFGPGRIATS